MNSYYIGLSCLSINEIKGGDRSGRLKQILSKEARRILCRLAGRDINDEIEIGENGRPFIQGGRIDFNISHSGSMAAVSFIKKESERNFSDKFRTGCDIQLIKSRVNMTKVAIDFFSPEENEYIFNGNKKESLSDLEMSKFYHIWTLKECLIKLKGLTVFDMRKLPSFFYCKRRESLCFSYEENHFSPSFFLYELYDRDSSYVLAVSTEGAFNIRPNIRWFTQSLPVKSIVEIKAAKSPPDTVRPKT